MKIIRFELLFFIAVLMFSCSVSKTPGINHENRKKYKATIENADEFWSLRADTGIAYHAIWALEALAKQDTESVDLWAKLSRAYYFNGQFLEDTPSTKDSLFMEGYEASQRILKRNESYYNLLFSTGDEGVAVRGLNAQYVDVLYWGMANYGRWLETKGPLVRRGQRDLIWTTLEHIHDLDSNYYHGAYYRYKGALMARDPESGRDTLAIKNAFETAIEIAPDYLGNYTFMAMYYCPLVNDKDLFYSLLTKVITSSPAEKLPYYPENMHEKTLADRLMIKAENENWFHTN